MLGAPDTVPARLDLGAVGGWVPQRPPDARPAEELAPGRVQLAALRDRLPAGVQAVAIAPSGRALVGLLLVVTVAVATTGATAWVARPQEQRAPGRDHLLGRPLASPSTAAATGAPGAGPVDGPTDGAATSSGSSTASPAVVLVHVAGAVRRPGLVELPTGARVADAVAAAGGVTAAGNPASVNLARTVVDGEQVVVARRGEEVVPLPGPPSAGTAPGAAGALIDLNTATLEQLDGLPGIGPVLAQRILDWRTANGRFSVVEELGEVSGIGEATLADLRPLVTV